MAYSGGNPFQRHNFNPFHTPNHPGQNEAHIYDLDDPYLIPNVLSRQQQQHPSVPERSITCRFSAIPLNVPGAFSHNMAQYGYIIHESQDKLIIRLPHSQPDLLNHVRQVWVSKYLAPFTECHITFEMPKRDPRDPARTTLVIIQRVLPKTNMSGGAHAFVQPAPVPVVSLGEGAMPHQAPRRRAASLPSPRVRPWHLPKSP
ncbi:hypothetical protein F4803DRAFT_554505 [Xylaria telfairii]|nr:hypothetical protein F4803DRAFT_554505 [Xylaria telfairii]